MSISPKLGGQKKQESFLHDVEKIGTCDNMKRKDWKLSRWRKQHVPRSSWPTVHCREWQLGKVVRDDAGHQEGVMVGRDQVIKGHSK